LVLFIAALVLFGLCARHAVRASRAAARIVDRRTRLVEPAKRGVLIINPLSGGGKAVRFDLVSEARSRGVEPLLLGRGMNLLELAERVVDNGADVIGMAGGDGSQALLATVAMRRDVAHVCVPAGTRNHFALDLGLDRNDLVGALDAFTEGIERRIDLARVNDHVFVNNASLGLYAAVVQSDAYRDAKLGTWRSLLPEMVGPGASAIDLQFDDGDSKEWSDATLVVVSNNPYRLKRFAGVGSRPALDTGRLGIFAARAQNARTVAKLVTLGTLGQQHRSGGMRHWASADFEVRSDASVAVGLDGEALLLSPPLRFQSLPGVLRVRLPRHASGMSPAGNAVTLSRANLCALVKIAVGRRIEAAPHV
jgi:diacylglycerol kinase family enzyme